MREKTRQSPLFLWTIFLLFAAPNVSAYESLGTVEFKAATVGDASRVISELAKVDVVVTDAAKNKLVSLYIKDASVESTIDSMCRITGLWYRKNTKFNIFYIMTEEEFGNNVVVEQEYTTRIFELKHQNVSDAAYAIEALFGIRVTLSEPKDNASYELDGDFGGGEDSSSDNDDDKPEGNA